MKLFSKLNIFIILVFAISACENFTPTPVQEATSLPERGIAVPHAPNSFVPFESVKTTPPPGIVQIEFLIDKSGSMNSNCSNPSIARGADGYVSFMLETFKREIQETYRKRIFIGVSAFADTFTAVRTPIDLGSLEPNVTITNNPEDQGKTNLSSSIENAYSSMQQFSPPDPKESAIQKRYLIVVTDGSVSDIEGVRKKIMEMVTQDPSLNVYMALWCSPILQEWTNSSGLPVIIKTGGELDIFPDVESMSIKLMDDLVLYFHSGMQVKRATSTSDLTTLGGYYTSVGVSFWSRANQLKVISGANAPILQPGVSQEIQLSPIEKCGVHEFETYLSNIQGDLSSLGIVIFSPRTIQILNLELDDFQIVNGEPVDVRFKISSPDLGVSKRLDELKDCFRVEPVVNKSPMYGVAHEPCDNTNLVCLDENLSGEFQWKPFLPDHDEYAELLVNLHGLSKTKDDVSRVTYSWKALASIVVKSRPIIDGVEAYYEGEKTTKIGYEFDYNREAPEIFLITKLSDEELYAQSRKLNETDETSACEMPDLNLSIDGQPVRVKKIPNAIDNKDYEELLNTNKRFQMYFSLMSNEKRQYVLDVYTYIMRDCGFEQLAFKWDEQNRVSEIGWVCDILQSKQCHVANIDQP